MAMTELFTPERWTHSHQDEILSLLGAFYPIFVMSIREATPDGNTRFFDLGKRTYSEMPLCRGHMAVSTELGLPRNFTVITGAVDTHGEALGERTNVPHQFLTNINGITITEKNGVIVDFTAAQFVIQGMKPGDRSATLRALGGDLVTLFPNGLTVLQGNHAEIRERIGLTYKLAQTRPNAG